MKRLALALLLLSLTAVGCGEAQLADASEQDYRLVMQLNAALGSKRVELLDATHEKLTARHEEGKIPTSAYHRLEGIIDTARQGDWSQAHQECLAFMKGQSGNRSFARN